MSKAVKKASKIAPVIELLSSFVGRYSPNWYIAYCNPRCESRAFRGPMAKGILAWLPEQDVERKQPKTKRKFTVRMPFFARYFFVGIDPLRRQLVSDVHLCDSFEGLVKIEEMGVPYQVSADHLVPLFACAFDSEQFKAGSRFKICKFLERPLAKQREGFGADPAAQQCANLAGRGCARSLFAPARRPVG